MIANTKLNTTSDVKPHWIGFTLGQFNNREMVNCGLVRSENHGVDDWGRHENELREIGSQNSESEQTLVKLDIQSRKEGGLVNGDRGPKTKPTPFD
jgi:hypothetical protein